MNKEDKIGNEPENEWLPADREVASSMAAIFDFEISVEELGLWIAV